MEPEEIVRCVVTAGKHVSAALDMHAAIEKLLETVWRKYTLPDWGTMMLLRWHSRSGFRAEEDSDLNHMFS
jgi:hypothetical protein